MKILKLIQLSPGLKMEVSGKTSSIQGIGLKIEEFQGWVEEAFLFFQNLQSSIEGWVEEVLSESSTCNPGLD